MQADTKKFAGKCLDILSTVLVVMIVLCTVLLVGARVVGLSVYTIVSGSMEPTYHVGDLIYVKKVAAETIQVGDPITFVLNDDLVVATHRVVEVDSENQCFYTKGDHNQVADIAPVHFKNFIGKPVFSIPYLGYVSNWVKSPPGLYIALAVGVAALGLVFIPDMFRQADKEKAGQEKAASEQKPAAEQPPADR